LNACPKLLAEKARERSRIKDVFIEVKISLVKYKMFREGAWVDFMISKRKRCVADETLSPLIRRKKFMFGSLLETGG
jgi:hypothetical protein